MSDQCCQFTMTDEDELDRPDDTAAEQTASPQAGCCGADTQVGTTTAPAGSSCCGGPTATGATSMTAPVA